MFFLFFRDVTFRRFFYLGRQKVLRMRIRLSSETPPSKNRPPKKEVLELAERVHFDSIWTPLGPARGDWTSHQMLCIYRFGSFLDSGQEFAFSNCLGKPPRSFGFEI